VGSCFWFELAAADAPFTGPAHTPVRTVLCIEEAATCLQHVEELMALCPGACLLRAGDIDSGMAIAHQARPDVILVNLPLRDPGGMDARMLLARDPATAHIPVIALDDDGAHLDVDSSLPAGFSGQLLRPLQHAAFIEALDLATPPQQTGGQRATA
jgi:CheY-like chemotaxis protein